MLFGIRRAATRIDAATPPRRDRAVDALRALAILGVVLGHWLVTALVADGATLRAASPLGPMPWLAPVSWMFQTLAVFFMVGGHVATRSLASARARGGTYGAWLSTRLTRLFVPVAALLGCGRWPRPVSCSAARPSSPCTPWSNWRCPPCGSCWSSPC